MRSRVSAAMLAALSLIWSSSILADFDKGKAAIARGDYTVALKEFNASAQAGEAKSQAALGLLYSAGELVTPDYAKALMWLQKAAAQGEAAAQFGLGMMYK